MSETQYNKTYSSIKDVKALIKDNHNKVMSLGNGMFCLNGQSCDFKPILQSSNCNPKCENLIADHTSIVVWKKRYLHYKSILADSLSMKMSDSDLQFLQLEIDFYKEALEFFGEKYE